MPSRRWSMKLSDPGFGDWARSILDESESKCIGDENVIDQGSESAHETESEEEVCEAENEVRDTSSSDENEPFSKRQNRQYERKKYYGKNRFIWSKKPPASKVRTRKHNIVSHLPGIIGPAKALGQICRPQTAWTQLFCERILNEIILQTNKKLAFMRERLSDDTRTDYKELDLIEFKTFLEILMFTAILKSNNEDLQAIFATDGTGRDIFRCTMSLKRVLVLLLSIRFDDASDRDVRKKCDATAPIKWVFLEFMKNCTASYSIGKYACIDEMMGGFHGRCRIKMYIPSKPRKYGLKIMTLADAKTHFLLNAHIYSGKDSVGRTPTDEENKLAKPTQAVLQLTKPIIGSNRNITADNWFSPIALIQELLKRGLTYVGTL
ncbi:piggyBac transposable element-derived protein 4-like [Schistocerca gregaria]|uniref:piggyBac transposable element-derived protein 4-like n=1 Tax=Schistocerca gregaria TaxID=7010 RepID=UPI00211F1CD5|nr:piggyBac transposable element-derived protein 4-like [Schistocerca gregaria]